MHHKPVLIKQVEAADIPFVSDPQLQARVEPPWQQLLLYYSTSAETPFMPVVHRIKGLCHEECPPAEVAHMPTSSLIGLIQ